METSVLGDLREKLINATGINEIKALLASPEVIEFLKISAKEPFVRKVLLSLSSPIDNEDAHDKAYRYFCLGVLSSVKGLNSIVDEYARKLLFGPIPDFTLLLSSREKLVVANWLHTKKITCALDLAAEAAISERNDEEVRMALLKIVFARSYSLSDAISELTRFVSTEATAQLLHDTESRQWQTALVLATFRVAAGCKNPPGVRIAACVSSFIHSVFGRDCWEESGGQSEMAEALMQLLSECARRSPNVLLQSHALQVLKTCEESWILRSDKKWKKDKAALVPFIENMLITALQHGASSPACIEWIGYLTDSSEAVRKTANSILNEWDIPNESARNWLEAIKQGREPISTGTSQSDVEAMAASLLRAYEFEQSFVRNEDAAAQAEFGKVLSIEVRQMAWRFGLKLDFDVGDVIPFDPMRHKSVSDETGSRVRVILPGVVRSVDAARNIQIIPALVENDCSS